MSEGRGITVAKSRLVKVPKASELVAANLRRRIITGELGSGDLLPSEVVLMQEFGVSRPTLREAFRILESESIITVQRGARGGGRVLQPDGAVAARYMGILLQYQGVPLSDLYQARTEVEVSAVGMIGSGRRKTAIRELETKLAEGQEFLSEEDEERFAEFSVAFHLAVVEAAGSATLSLLGGMLFEIIDAHNKIFVATHDVGLPVNRVAMRAYTKLVSLLADGNTEGAQRHWRRHLGNVERYMVGDTDSTLVEVLS
ncbi:FadR family transcriptional regulator [Mycolicibacterium fluoranthenivorans]|uniref:FadR family transcriptional regulator n=2 Tax=Mycolicibacterium fluoranthenivorans TaxID=258505 RepID=A0A7G8PNC9_9MYCO|nr:FadR family transcriptional regulator [Mycolicibacterium fluoranthenivorans]